MSIERELYAAWQKAASKFYLIPTWDFLTDKRQKEIWREAAKNLMEGTGMWIELTTDSATTDLATGSIKPEKKIHIKVDAIMAFKINPSGGTRIYLMGAKEPFIIRETENEIKRLLGIK